MIKRWTNYNADKAMERFDELVDAGLEGIGLDSSCCIY
jgi:tagatose-1,6-bisphosphate aldolase non-catalytic subunit AgaZ/GatZ